MTDFLPTSIIETKRDGGVLSEQQIKQFIDKAMSGGVDSAQIAALCMAIYLNDLNHEETSILTQAFADSGKKLDWSSFSLDGPILDKHSSGGIGDKVTFILCPLIAACGGYMGKMSGRGLGYTGGTIDKLESIPNYQTAVSMDQYLKTVKNVGCAIIAQTDDLAPVDKKFYAIRDTTATVDHIGLITASIVSKKLAMNSQGFLADIKMGTGAFAQDIDKAQQLATSIQSVATASGLPTRAVITDMNQVLGHSAGNSVEVIEALDFLTGHNRHPRLETLIFSLGTELLMLGGLADTAKDAHEKLRKKLHDGSGADIFERMIVAMGGSANLLNSYRDILPTSDQTIAVHAPETGYVSAIDLKKNLAI